MRLKRDIDVLTGEGEHNRFVSILAGTHASTVPQPEKWHPSSWREAPMTQLPEYPDECTLRYYELILQSAPPLVLATEIRQFRHRMTQVAKGKSFLLQGGDCAESFDGGQATSIRDHFLTLTQMAGLIHEFTGLPVLKIGRIAGQFAKPRSQQEETRDGMTLPSFRGEIINGQDFSQQGRTPDPQRMLRAYYHAAATMNLLRAINASELPDYSDNLSVQVNSGSGRADHDYHRLCKQLYASYHQHVRNNCLDRPLFTSHEALLLHYEEAMTRKDTVDGAWYNCSAHMLWLGERTGDPDGAHVNYLRGVANPVGIKCGPNMTPERLLALLDILDPDKQPGKIVLIMRMGFAQIEERIPPLLQAVRARRHPVIWAVDPMHGNTRSTPQGYKTRSFSCIVEEVRRFTRLLKEKGEHPGGLHIEMTGEDVTECTGGLQHIDDKDLSYRYLTLCDPRLNRMQSLELSYRLGEAWRGL
ncbi:3-deoxy-7-phosphoheptulonate synthase [Serratia marcescens]|uniref:Phospho-2-dehydro-3-deoxyheptonate aldolase n=1 Tax=Serratia marcescens TaxID=615 RepID=A0A5C7C2P8_SERMA|nr:MULTISPECIES: 3-deoxy-7-phosphoheptulonate synthase class II [Serratia]TXE27115.1 3-deoxy-7-phosphoheptulonate synthase [Serratia marcescens]TXE55328.1 3-deoxy-7-phosphoheptulonate synthase [Serratia marcescens]